MGSCSLLQGIFPTQGWNMRLLPLQVNSFTTEPSGKPLRINTSPWIRKIHWRRDRLLTPVFLGFPRGSAGKESACNAGDPSPIPGLGRSTGEGTGYPLQYSRASLVAQTVKNPPATWQIWVQSLDWEDPLEKGMVTHSNTLAWRIPWTV